MFDWLKKSMEESPGVPSSVRIQMLAVTGAVLLVLLGLTAAIVLKRVADVPPGVVTLCSLVFTGAAAAKVVQKFAE